MRPIFIIPENSSTFLFSADSKVDIAGKNLDCSSLATAMCMAVGNVSLELCGTIKMVFVETMFVHLTTKIRRVQY